MGKYETVKLIDPLSLLNLWEGCTFMKTRFACVTLCLQPARTICYHDYIYITIPHEPFAAIRSILDLFRSLFLLTEPNLAAKRKKYLAHETKQGSPLAPLLPLHLRPSPWLHWPVSHTPLSNARLDTPDVSSFYHGFHSARCVHASTETVSVGFRRNVCQALIFY